jgi:hypothetical protein
LRIADVARSGLHIQYLRCKVFVLAAHVLIISENKHDSGNNNDEHDSININSHRSAAAAAAAAAGSSSTPSNYFDRAT